MQSATIHLEVQGQIISSLLEMKNFKCLKSFVLFCFLPSAAHWKNKTRARDARLPHTLHGLPHPGRCLALCSTPLRWRGCRSRCDSGRAQTPLRWSSPEPDAAEAPTSWTWLQADSTEPVPLIVCVSGGRGAMRAGKIKVEMYVQRWTQALTVSSHLAIISSAVEGGGQVFTFFTQGSHKLE